MNTQLKNRLLSFTWRLGNVLAIAGLNFLAENIADIGMPLWAAGIVGLIAGEITKYLNRRK